MRLKTKLVLTATGLTFTIVVLLSCAYLAEMLRQRVEQTAAANDVLAREVLLMTRLAVESGLRANPPADTSVEAFRAALTGALRDSDGLSDVMNAIVRYSPTVQEVSVTDWRGITLVSTNPDAVDQRMAYRTTFATMQDGSLAYKFREVFGEAQVLDIPVPLDRNGKPFLVVHVGVRSTFLRNAYAPWIRAAVWFALLAALASMLAAALLSNVALHPLEGISDELERLTLSGGSRRGELVTEPAERLLEAPGVEVDAVGRVRRNIDRLGRQIRTTEEGYSALQTNLDQMLDTLRDGVLLFTAERRAIMVSDAVIHFIDGPAKGSPGLSAAHQMVGLQLEDIFRPETALGEALTEAFRRQQQVAAELVVLEDGRQVQFSLDRIEDDRRTGREMGTLLTLRDTGSALEIEQELEVSRRLAAIGRLTAGVGHEVKNPINAMVVHLELLRGKLAAEGIDKNGAQRHVNILTDEMHRLDRVVQTLADFSRPMTLDLRECDLGAVIGSVVELTGGEMREHDIKVETDLPQAQVPVRVDAELIRQALLNLMLNGMQAMLPGGCLRISLRRDNRLAVVEIADDGAGIPAGVLPRIFDLYFTTKPTGSGIGLAMTYRILQLHGGALDVRSDAEPLSPSRGTTFTLRLPLSVGPGMDSRRLVETPERKTADLPTARRTMASVTSTRQS